jgi:uncharacterized membrane protein (DUF2068 family)
MGVALWLTLSPEAAYQVLGKLAREVRGISPLGANLTVWVDDQLSSHVLSRAALFAWLAGLSNAIEGLLLLRGGVWGERLVALELACLLPFEVRALIRHVSTPRALLLAFNVFIVLYLVWKLARPRMPAVPRTRIA